MRKHFLKHCYNSQYTGFCVDIRINDKINVKIDKNYLTDVIAVCALLF